MIADPRKSSSYDPVGELKQRSLGKTARTSPSSWSCAQPSGMAQTTSSCTGIEHHCLGVVHGGAIDADEAEIDISSWGSDSLDDEAVCDLELFVVDQPADAVQYRGFGFEGGGVAEQRAGLLDGGVLAAWRCCQLESAYCAVVPDRNSVQLTGAGLGGLPNQPAAMARKPGR